MMEGTTNIQLYMILLFLSLSNSGPLTEARKRTRQTILCEILWPSGVNIGTTNAAVRDILSAFVDAIQLPEEGDSHKVSKGRFTQMGVWEQMRQKENTRTRSQRRTMK